MNWKQRVPLVCRMKINKIRKIKSFSDLFGRYSVGAMRAYVAFTADSNEWAKVSIGKEAQIHRGTLLHINAVTKKIQIGERVFIGQNCFFSAGTLIAIERDCLIGASCKFLGAGHEYTDPLVPYAKANVVSYGDILLEANCWIGTGSTLVGNVRIGYGSIVAANSLVCNDVLPLSLVVGNPAKLRKLFDWRIQKWIEVSSDPVLQSETIRRHIEQLPTIETFVSLLKVDLN